MRPTPLGEAYHIERAIAARQGISRYPCGCERCHGLKSQSTHRVEVHHRKYGRDRRLNEPLLVSSRINHQFLSAYSNLYHSAHNFLLWCTLKWTLKPLDGGGLICQHRICLALTLLFTEIYEVQWVAGLTVMLFRRMGVWTSYLKSQHSLERDSWNYFSSENVNDGRNFNKLYNL